MLTSRLVRPFARHSATKLNEPKTGWHMLLTSTMHTIRSFSNSIRGQIVISLVSGHNSEARSKALYLLYNPLQLERVGLALTGFIRTNPRAPAGPCLRHRIVRPSISNTFDIDSDIRYRKCKTSISNGHSISKSSISNVVLDIEGPTLDVGAARIQMDDII
jgi:hypothetical protein